MRPVMTRRHHLILLTLLLLLTLALHFSSLFFGLLAVPLTYALELGTQPLQAKPLPNSLLSHSPIPYSPTPNFPTLPTPQFDKTPHLCYHFAAHE